MKHYSQNILILNETYKYSINSRDKLSRFQCESYNDKNTLLYKLWKYIIRYYISFNFKEIFGFC